MASSTSYSAASASFSLTRSRTLRDPIFSFYPSQRQLDATRGASLSFPSWRTLKGLKVQNPRFLPRIQCIRDTRATPVSEDLWEDLILKSENPVLVEFYASWCGPCRMVHRVIDEIAAEYAGKLKCFILNTDTDLKIAEDYEIKAVPVVLLFKNGRRCDTVIGTMPKEFYVSAVEKLLNP